MKLTDCLKLAAIILAVHVDTALGQINKCVDAAGKTVYSQSPCPTSTKSSTVRAATAASGGVNSTKQADQGAAKSPPTTAELERDFRKRRSEQEEAAKKSAEKNAQAKDKEENCRAARGQLVSLESGARQQRVDEKGERVFMDDSQLPAELERARRAVQGWCG